MMNKRKTRFGAWKVVAVLPIVALLLMVGCKPAADKNVVQEEIPFEASNVDQSKPIDANTDDVFEMVEVAPEFPGGTEALYRYLAGNVKYPEKAKADGTEGRVIVSFVVEKDGSVTDAQVRRGVSNEVDAEALRVVQGMPKWTPGMQQGTPVRVHYNLPITFKLQ